MALPTAYQLTLFDGPVPENLPQIPTSSKVCACCRFPKPATEFYGGKSWKDGLHPYCKGCFSAEGKRRREKKLLTNPPTYRWQRDTVQHNYFGAVTTPTQAYLLGFLAADGNVLASQDRISLELSTKDEALLALVGQELAPDHRLRYRARKGNTFVALAFTSAQMVADLGRFGIVPAKTHILRWPANLPDNLAHAYLLGYFDGDGFITSGFTNGPHWRRYWGITSGSRALLEDMIDVIRKHTGVVVGGRGKRAPWVMAS